MIWILALLNALDFHKKIIMINNIGINKQNKKNKKQKKMENLKGQRKYAYTPVAEWRDALPQFRWIHLKADEMTIQEDCDYSLYVLINYGGKLRQHAFIPNAERPEGYSLVHREKYPPVSEWEKTDKYSIKLNDGEYTIITHRTTGRGLYLLVKINGVLRVHPYLQYGKFQENFKLVPVVRNWQSIGPTVGFCCWISLIKQKNRTRVSFRFLRARIDSFWYPVEEPMNFSPRFVKPFFFFFGSIQHLSFSGENPPHSLFVLITFSHDTSFLFFSFIK